MEQMWAQCVQVQRKRPLQGQAASMPEIEGLTSWTSDGVQGDRRQPEPILPEDILYQIHALMPMKDAAYASTVSRGFLRSWHCYPNLVFDSKMFGINGDTPNNINEITSDFIGTVDHIMTNHSGTGVKKFKLQTYPYDNLHLSYVDRCLQVATTPGIEEVELQMPWCNKIEYNFPCSLLSSKKGSSLQSFVLDRCAFHPAAEVGCLSSLTSVHLSSVRITAEELCSFLSKSLALKQLDIYRCNDIVCLKIPYELSHLNFVL